MLKLEGDVTRVDFERAGKDVVVKKWFGKWREGSAPTITDYVLDTGIERLLADCEGQYGMTVEMCDSNTGRALRGEITRIDFIEEGNSIVVKKFPYGWTAKTRPIATKKMSKEEGLQHLQHYKDGRWKIREFPGGARAWKYEVMPVRDTQGIRAMRRNLETAKWRGEGDNKCVFDLAFDC